ncbi:MAG: YjgN family protein [Proteobacteria bacterium]|nr:YjgN family protein [Pseudomonadota bacterium]
MTATTDTQAIMAGDASLTAGDTTGGSSTSVDFSISLSQLFVRLVKNKLFGFLTFGIYRFWGKTHVRRIMWHGTSIGGDRLEYMGTAKELFIGFLIAMVILMPIMLIAGLIVDFMTAAGAESLAIGQVLNLVFLYTFWQFARYRLWRYRLSRTSWRGIRFFLAGSAFKYAINVLLWTIVSLITLGWGYPLLQAYKLNYRLNNTCFGDGEFRYHGTVKGLYRIYWPAILIAQIIIGGTVAFLYGNDALDVSMESGVAIDQGQLQFDEQSMILFGIGGLIIFMTMSILSFAVKVWEFRYLAEQTTFLNASFSSILSVRSVLMIFILLIVLGLIGYVGFGALIILVLKYQTEAAIFVFVLAFFISYLAFDILKMLFLIVPLVRAVCHSLTIYNFEVFEHTAANAENSPKYGEGFADAMDVGAF